MTVKNARAVLMTHGVSFDARASVLPFFPPKIKQQNVFLDLFFLSLLHFRCFLDFRLCNNTHTHTPPSVKICGFKPLVFPACEWLVLCLSFPIKSKLQLHFQLALLDGAAGFYLLPPLLLQPDLWPQAHGLDFGPPGPPNDFMKYLSHPWWLYASV